MSCCCPECNNDWGGECLYERIAELEASFDLRWKADQRAIKMWQAAHPGNDLVWPDHADLCVWLLERLTQVMREKDEALNASQKREKSGKSYDPSR